MTRAAGLTRLLLKTYVLYSLYRALRWQAPAAMPNEARAVFDEHYRGQFELFGALARHLLALGGGCSGSFERIGRGINTFDARRRVCAADHLRVLLAAHQTVLTETRALTRARRALRSPGTAEMVDQIALANELQSRIVAGQLTACGRA
jgi:DNA-binding ferritin-like protein